MSSAHDVGATGSGNGEAPAARTKAASRWEVAIHRDHKTLEASWRKLEARGHCTAFQTYDWASCWYDAVTAHSVAEPVIAVVSRPGSEPVWILPLCLHRQRGLRIISFADLGISDYAAPVIASDAPSDIREVKAMIRALLKSLPRCDLIRLQKLPEEVEGVPNPLLAHAHTPFPANCYGIQLRGPWPELAEKIMQRRLRSTVRQQKNRLEKLGPVSIDHDERPETIEAAMDTLMAMRRARFDAIDRADMPSLWREFYYNLATRRDRSLGVSVTSLKASGEPIAACFGLTRGKTYLAILPTFAMGEWEAFRPGMLLFDAMLESHAARTKGSGYFDFTIGDEPYKKRFGGESHPLFEWMVPRSPIGAAAYLAWRVRDSLRRNSRVGEQTPGQS